MDDKSISLILEKRSYGILSTLAHVLYFDGHESDSWKIDIEKFKVRKEAERTVTAAYEQFPGNSKDARPSIRGLHSWNDLVMYDCGALEWCQSRAITCEENVKLSFRIHQRSVRNLILSVLS